MSPTQGIELLLPVLASQWISAVTSHNETCVTKCQLRNLTVPESWGCVDLANFDFPPVALVFEAGLCPGGTSNVCVLDPQNINP